MPEQTEKKHQQNRDANQNVAAPASAADDLTQKDLDQIVGGSQKFIIRSEGTKQDPQS